MSIPTDASQFPTFYELPAASDSSGSKTDAQSSDSLDGGWCLLAQVKENMTITQPTLIVTDRTGVDFALLFQDSMSLKGFRKGYTIAVPRATRTEREGEGKKAIVRVPAGRGSDVTVIPGSLERVFELAVVMGSEEVSRKCAACGKTEDTLMKCTGCGFTAYCGKACQVRGWSDMDHKSNCKVLKAMKDIRV
ncbi:hypothetical protein F5Y19DRAFT_414080 [Xylariaceae sp. FL1651]|nr:hypothetical protein F5Y19DRAFT_414080 [Xylariaceae sp. FL1651]